MENDLPRSVRYVKLINTISASLGVLLALLLTAAVVLPSISGGKFVRAVFSGILMLVLFSLPVVAPLLLNKGLSKLRPSARQWQIIYSSLMLFGFPVGTVLGGICLYFMLSQETEKAFIPQ